MNSGPVIFGVDFSPFMRRAVPWVREFISPGSATLLAHAVDVPPLPPFLKNVVSPAAAQDKAIEDADERLAALRARSGASDAEIVVRIGRSDQVLDALARERNAALIVIGAHGEPTRPWQRIGSTTERLLRAAETSVLIGRGAMIGAPARILVAVDDVAITPCVLARAGAIAEANGADLHAVHVLSRAAYSHLLSAEAAEAHDPAVARAQLEDDLAAETLRWLRALWANTRRHTGLHAHVPHGRPADEILRVARERSADLIVIGRYGIGRVLPAMLGSVLGSVVAGAECPVLVVTG